MNGLKIIISAVFGIFIPLIILVWGVWSYIDTNENRLFIEDILKKVEEISDVPQLLKSKENEIEKILFLIDTLDNPMIKSLIFKLKDGLVPNLNLQRHVGNKIEDIMREVRREIASRTSNLQTEIGGDVQRQLDAIKP